VPGEGWNDPDPEILQKSFLSAEDARAIEATVLAMPRVPGAKAYRIVAHPNGVTVSFIQIDRASRRYPAPQ